MTTLLQPEYSVVPGGCHTFWFAWLSYTNTAFFWGGLSLKRWWHEVLEHIWTPFPQYVDAKEHLCFGHWIHLDTLQKWYFGHEGLLGGQESALCPHHILRALTSKVGIWWFVSLQWLGSGFDQHWHEPAQSWSCKHIFLGFGRSRVKRNTQWVHLYWCGNGPWWPNQSLVTPLAIVLMLHPIAVRFPCIVLYCASRLSSQYTSSSWCQKNDNHVLEALDCRPPCVHNKNVNTSSQPNKLWSWWLPSVTDRQ